MYVYLDRDDNEYVTSKHFTATVVTRLSTSHCGVKHFLFNTRSVQQFYARDIPNTVSVHEQSFLYRYTVYSLGITAWTP
jgi:hypothetical protein